MSAGRWQKSSMAGISSRVPVRTSSAAGISIIERLKIPQIAGGTRIQAEIAHPGARGGHAGVPVFFVGGAGFAQVDMGVNQAKEFE